MLNTRFVRKSSKKSLKAKEAKQFSRSVNGLAVLLREAFDLEAKGLLLSSQCKLYQGLMSMEEILASEKKDNKFDALCGAMDNFRSLLRKIDTKVCTLIGAATPLSLITMHFTYMDINYDGYIGKYFNSKVMEMLVQEPYLNTHFNFKKCICLLEMAMKRCPNLKVICLTAPEEHLKSRCQLPSFVKVRSKLKARKIELFILFSSDILCREIFLDTGFRLQFSPTVRTHRKSELLQEDIEIARTYAVPNNRK